MSPDLFLWLSLAAMTLSMLSACGSLSLQNFAVHELEELCERKHRESWFTQIMERRDWLTLGAESGRVIFTVIGVSSLTIWLLPVEGIGSWTVAAWFWTLGTIVLVVLIANTWVPFAISQSIGEYFVFYTWRIFWVASSLAFPAIGASYSLNEVFQRAAGIEEEEDDDEEWLEDEIRSMVSEGERGGLLESDERDMIEGVMELDEKDVFGVMTPRSRVDALNSETDWNHAVEFVVGSGRTRVPVYVDRLDNIVGVLFAKDLLRESLKEPSQRLTLPELVRPALTVPESIMLDEMLQRFLRERRHMAIVLDEYGAFSGIITIEDILEEIVGEIVDETDRESFRPKITVLNGVAVVLGDTRVDEVNEELGTEIPEDDEFDTVAGWIMARTRQIPRSGTYLTADQVDVRILKSSRRVIEQIEIKSPEVATTSNGQPAEV